MRQITKSITKLFFFSLFLFACQKGSKPVEIKLLLLNSENYLNQNIYIQGKIKEIGPLNLWFILEDDSAYIQISSENLSKKLSCLQKGKTVSAFGTLKQFGVHKYFSLQNDLKCL
jgi:hypothetical protein